MWSTPRRVTRGPTRRDLLRATLAFGAAGCNRFRRANDVVVGEVAARTGARALWGEDLHRGLELAVAQQNARGGLNGRTIRLVVADDESRAEICSVLETVCAHTGVTALHITHSRAEATGSDPPPAT